ncbi:sodium:solute symporter [Thermococcus sibiricus]|uniref:Na+/solute symporter n=1 Tax=Thermococcus sibiricus TaxID=172049 RepID=A0A101EK99_9EURY|nr:sodium:solute symporter family protein [Thermococcus sibiricus]KUK16727.1 MAG: Na+/solute symporter [Thermococcus sibiricus]
MAEGTIALLIIFGWILLTTIVAIIPGIRKKLSLDEWFVAGRSLGLVVIFFAVAAEIYSGFAFLGLAGWAYNFGVPILYALAYFVTAYSTGFVITPYYNKLARKLNLLTQPDFFVERYESRMLGALVAIIGIIFFVPYIQLQIGATGIIIELASYGAITRNIAMVVAFLLVAFYIFIGGFKGIAWTNVLQGIIMWIIAISLVSVPFKVFGGIEPMFKQLEQVSPQHLTLPGAAGAHPIAWYMSTLLLTTLGFWMFPHLVMRAYAAKDEKTIMKTNAWMAWYSLLAFPIVLIGLGAVLLYPNLKNPDWAVMWTARDLFSPWMVGLIGAGGAAAAISTGSGLIHATASLFSRNMIQRGLVPGLSDEKTANLAKIVAVLVTIIALLLQLYAPTLLVSLLLMSYSGIIQFLPGILLGLKWRKVTKIGVASGLIIGVLVVVLTTFVWTNPLGIHAGIWGVIVNFIVTIIVSTFTIPASEETVKKFIEALSD